MHISSLQLWLGFGGSMAPMVVTYPSFPTSTSAGSSVNVSGIHISNAPDGTTLYWTLNTTLSNASASDFYDGSSGSFTVSGGSGSMFWSIKLNSTGTPRNLYFYFDIRSGSASGPVISTTPIVYITEFFVTPQSNSVTEGNSLVFNVVTNNWVADATVLYYELGASTASAADFTTVTGSCTVTSRISSFSVTVAADYVVENENFTMQLRLDTPTGLTVATSSTVTIGDLIPTYSVTPNIGSLMEGGTATFSVATTNVPNGTTLYWTLNSTGTFTAADVVSASSGSFTITSGAGSFSVSPKSDGVIESTEYLIVDVRTGSTSGTVVATSSQVSIIDTPSLQQTAITSTPEGTTRTVTVATTGIADNTVFSWSISHITTTAADFVATSGTLTIVNNASSFSFTPVGDGTTEGTETFNVVVSWSYVQNGTTVNTTSTLGTLSLTDTTPQQVLFGTTIDGKNGIWTVPAGVTSVSISLIGAGAAGAFWGENGANPGGYGGGGGGAGGSLAYSNNMSVTPGGSLFIIIAQAPYGGVVQNTTNSSGVGGISTVRLSTSNGTVLVSSGQASCGRGNSTFPGMAAYSGGLAGTTGAFSPLYNTAFFVGGRGGSGSSTTGGHGGHASPYSSNPATPAASTSTTIGNIGNGVSLSGTSPGGGPNFGAGLPGATFLIGMPSSGPIVYYYQTNSSTYSPSWGGVRIVWPGSTRQYPSTNLSDTYV